MLTIEKLNVYKRYRGYYDGYYVQNKTSQQQVITSKEWVLIDGLVQDIYIVRKGEAAKTFADQLNIRLHENCDSEETIQQLMELEAFLSGTK
jgi:hypothetical protein